MANTYFVGLRGTDDNVSNERPENWRAGILRLYPNGDMPLTALTGLMPSTPVDDPHFHWWTEAMPSQRATVTGRYTDSALANAYVSGATAGTTLYFSMSAADVAQFRVGHQVLLRDASDYTVDVNGKVTAVSENGASSYIAVLLLEADDNGTGGTHDLSDCDVAMIIGSINSEGATRPDAITISPTEFENYTQIFRTSIDLTRTMMKTKMRSEDAYPKAKKDGLWFHGIEMEKAFMWGIKSQRTGSNGKPERTTDGLLAFIKGAGTVADYSLDAATEYDGKTWLEAGERWMDEHLEEIFRYGGDEKLCFAGSGALLGIQRLAKATGSIQLQVRDAAYGIRVITWVTPFGEITLKRHPLFSYEATNRNSMVIFEPKNIAFRYVDDTFFKADNSDRTGGGTGKDGKDEEWLTEGGLEFYHGETCGYLNGVGLDNA